MPVFNPPQLIYDNPKWGSDAHRKEWLLETKETEEYVMEITRVEIEYYSTGEFHRSEHKSKCLKFLCVNGVLAGTKVTEQKGAEFGYVPFNCAKRAPAWPRKVLIHPIGRAETFLFKIVDDSPKS